MALDLAHERRAHELLDRLTPDKLAAVRGLLQTMVDPGGRSPLTAPSEDEDISDDEERAVAEAREWLKNNRPIPHEQVRTELGLTVADFERMSHTP